MNDPERRFQRGVGPEPRAYLLPRDLPRMPAWIAVAASRPAVPSLPGKWIAADLEGSEPE